MLNLILALAGIYALFCLLAFLLHRYFIYVPDRSRVAPEDAGLRGVQEVTFKGTDGVTLIAWYIPARGGKPTLLFFPGQTGNASSRAGKIAMIAADGYGVFLVNYRGYGGSGGRPTEKRNFADAILAYDCLRAQGVSPDEIAAYGESLGTAIATHVSLNREIKALVLEATYKSVVDVALLMWPFLPLRLLMVDQYPVIDRIGGVKVPLLIIHGARDKVIPLDQARHVFHAANEPKRLVVVPHASHNDLFEQGAWVTVRDFLDGLPEAAAEAAPVKIAVNASR
ncbi:MAG: alpha/beta hydrolase [Methyloceanibacter sp.]